jgi:hypothetical protein
MPQRRRAFIGSLAIVVIIFPLNPPVKALLQQGRDLAGLVGLRSSVSTGGRSSVSTTTGRDQAKPQEGRDEAGPQ